MKISIIGTGKVGQTIAHKLLELGHDVMIGTRNVSEKLKSTAPDKYGNPPFSVWLQTNSKARFGTFSESAAFGEIVINATHGSNSIEALTLAGADNLAGKVLIDISNPLDFSKGMPPSLVPGLNNTNSLGEELQKTFPESKVVKTLNTMSSDVMINPGMLGSGDHINYISGNDDESKKIVRLLLIQIGWHDENIFDLGDITGARATESLLHIWLRLLGIMKTGNFNFRLVR